MDTYAQILTIAIPFFLVLIIIEWAYGKYRGMEVTRSFDTVSSLSSGVSNIIKDVLGLAVIIVSYGWMVEHISITQLTAGWLTYVLAFVGLDFAGYWSHRFEHEINILWNRHIIHHSSEEYNLACALRQNVSAIFAVFFFLLVPMAVIGVPAEVVAVVAPIHLFAQFWYHTKLIHRMGWLEYVLVTPSHHRVHHAINDQYLDKNYSQIFIIWDRLFGTFQPELEHVPAVYGVKRQSLTWNPFIINYQHLWLLLTDAWHTQSWADKIRVFYKETGWRPADRQIAAPITIVTDPYSQQKYDTPASPVFKVWMWVQLLVTVGLTLYLFNSLGDIAAAHIAIYGALLMVHIFAYTSLMDRSRLAVPAALLSTALCITLTISTGGWFSLGIVGGAGVISFYCVSLLATGYFLVAEPLQPRVSAT